MIYCCLEYHYAEKQYYEYKVLHDKFGFKLIPLIVNKCLDEFRLKNS